MPIQCESNCLAHFQPAVRGVVVNEKVGTVNFKDCRMLYDDLGLGSPAEHPCPRIPRQPIEEVEPDIHEERQTTTEGGSSYDTRHLKVSPTPPKTANYGCFPAAYHLTKSKRL